MILQRIYGVVRRAHNLYVVVLHQTARRELRVVLDQVIALVVNLLGGLGIQTLLYPKSRLQLQMCPVIKRVTERIRHRLCPFLKLLPVGRIAARAVTLRHPVRTHGTPLVVVAHQPNLCNRVETFVLGHHLRNQVAVIIDNRHLRRVLVVELLRCISLQEEIFVHECFHLCMFDY